MFTTLGMLTFLNWVEESLQRLFDHCAGFSPEELRQEFAGFGMASVWSQLTHMLGAEEYWLKKITPDWSVPEFDGATLEDLRVRQGTLAKVTADYLETLSDEALNTELSLEGDFGGIISRTPAFVLLHLMTHAFHHKGQVVAICRLLGRPAPDTDLLRFPGE